MSRLACEFCYSIRGILANSAIDSHCSVEKDNMLNVMLAIPACCLVSIEETGRQNSWLMREMLCDCCPYVHAQSTTNAVSKFWNALSQ